MQKNHLLIVLAFLNCAHTTHAVERLDQFNPQDVNPQEERALANITRSVLRDTIEKGMPNEVTVRVSQALAQLNKPNLLLRDAQNALSTLPEQVCSRLVHHTKDSALANIKTIYAVASLHHVEQQLEQMENKKASLYKGIDATIGMVVEILKEDSASIDPDRLSTMQNSFWILKHDLNAVGLEDYNKEIRTVLQDKGEEWFQLGQADSESLDKEIRALRIASMQDKLNTLEANLNIVQNGGDISNSLKKQCLKNRIDAMRVWKGLQNNPALTQDEKKIAQIPQPVFQYIMEKYL